MADDQEKCRMCGQARPNGYVCNRGVCGFARIVKIDGEEFQIPPSIHRMRLTVVNSNG